MDRTATDIPGLDWDPETKIARLEVVIPGTGGRKRRRKRETAKTYLAAVGKFNVFKEQVLAAQNADPSRPVTFADYIKDHGDTIRKRLSASSRSHEESVLKLRLLPFFGKYPLARINLAVVRDYVSHMKADYHPRSRKDPETKDETKTLAGATINRDLGILRKYLKDAVAREVLAVYPVKGRLPREKDPALALELKPEELVAFFGAFDDPVAFRRQIEADYRRDETVWLEDIRKRQPRRGAKPPLDDRAVDFHWQRFAGLRPLFVLAVETGLRRGDLLGLTWASIDEAAGWIRLAVRKTSETATIRLSPAAREALKVFKSRRRPGEDRVVVNEEGESVPTATLARNFAIAKRLAGINRRFRFHDLRHTFASRLASGNVSLQVIAKALGHTSTRMSERYARPSEEALRSVEAALVRSPLNSLLNSPTPRNGEAPLGVPAIPFAGSELGGTPSGIRTRDLHLERVTS